MNNSFKKIESQLYNFKNIDTKAKSIDLNINRILNDVSLGGGDMFGEKSSPTNAFSSSVENEVLKRESRDIDGAIERLKIKKQILLDEKELINETLNILSDEERQLIELRYFSRNKLTWINIAMNMGYDESTCRKLRNKIIKKLMNILEY